MGDDKQAIQQLLAESKRLSDLADRIRERMDAVTQEIADQAAASEKSKLTPPSWNLDTNPPKS